MKGERTKREGFRIQDSGSGIFLCWILVLVLISVSCVYFNPRNPYAHIVHWAKSYGGNEDEQMNTVIPVSDGGSIVAGCTYSFGTGGEDAWMMHLDREGNILWEKAYGTQAGDRINCIRYTQDNNLIKAGNMYSTDVEYESDIWVMKCDIEGDILWEKQFGWDLIDEIMWIDEIADGGYIIAGNSTSLTGDGYEKQSALLIKLTADGQYTWIQVYGGTEDDCALVVSKTVDGGAVFCGNTFSFGAGDSDFWLVKIDNEGDIIWEKAYGNPGEDRLCSCTQTTDGEFILTGLLDPAGVAGIDESMVYQVMKIDKNGDIVWQKALIYEFLHEPWTVYTSSVDETEVGNYIVAITAEIDDTKGLDVHVLKFDQTGTILWQRSYGGNADDHVMCIREMVDYGYVIAGKTFSFGVEKADSWIVKLLPSGECSPLDDIAAVTSESIPCEVTTTTASTEKIPSPAGIPPVDSIVTDTNCTVRQQAP